MKGNLREAKERLEKRLPRKGTETWLVFSVHSVLMDLERDYPERGRTSLRAFDCQFILLLSVMEL